jgi:CO/xanthine dehydrogenase Mo-binding subunit
MTAPAQQRPQWPERPPDRLEQRIVVERNGTIVARSGKVEYGQGIRTGFALIVAEELAVPVERVRIELGETSTVPWDMGTFGSMSTSVDGALLRAAAAFARHILIDRAALRFGVPASALTVRDGMVVEPGGRRMSFIDLTAGDPLSGEVPSERIEPRLPAPLIDAPTRVEARDIVTGSACYVADVRLPGMLRGHVLRPPAPGARVVSLADAAALAMPGVAAVVHEDDFVGVVAERDEQAVAAIDSLDVAWSTPHPKHSGDVSLALVETPHAHQAFGGAARILDAEYHLPHIAHASIGPSAAVAHVHDGSADLYVATQRPFALRDAAAEMLGIASDHVRVHPQTMSGLYGRGNMADAAIDALRLSRAVQRPVLVQWTRAEEFRDSPHRPALDARVRGALDDAGRIVAWEYEAWTNPHTYGDAIGPPQMVAMTAGRCAVPPYTLGATNVVLHVTPGAVRTGAFRSLGAAPHVFAIESFIDELARASEQDPIDFRLRHIEDERLRRVLEVVRERSGWTNRPRRRFGGWGVACTVYNGTYVAQVAAISTNDNQEHRVDSVWCAVDAGRLVHPDGARNQIEGGIQQAASWTMLEALSVDGTGVMTRGWRDYPIATAEDAPRNIDVEFVDAPPRPSTGVGEPGSVPTAAALANAVFDACGVRARQLPLLPPRALALRTHRAQAF